MGPALSKTELESVLARRFGASVRFREKPAVELVPTGVAAVDAVAGGLPRGCLTEVFGPSSSGRTRVMLSALAQATARDEVCALVDLHGAFSPTAAAAAGVALDRLLWVCCGGNANHALRALDLILQGGGFGLVIFDLGDLAPRYGRKIPLASWFRYRRVVENTPTVLLAVEQDPYAKSCASLVLEMRAYEPQWSGASFGRLLAGARLTVSSAGRRMSARKEVQSRTPKAQSPLLFHAQTSKSNATEDVF